jgi:branched-chain amino acid transport system ATP-binding protein
MSDPILSIRGLRKAFGPTEIMRGVDLDLRGAERHALIGPNGAGKSTLFHLLSGHLAPSAGEIRFDGQQIGGRTPQAINRLGLARSFQITNIFPEAQRVREHPPRGDAPARAAVHVLEVHRPRPRASASRPSACWNWCGCRRAPPRVAGEMAYSEQRSLEIAMTLASDPKVILLDEPMAGMSTEETHYTAQLIREVTQGPRADDRGARHGRGVLAERPHQRAGVRPGDRHRHARGDPRQRAVKEAYLGEEVAA